MIEQMAECDRVLSGETAGFGTPAVLKTELYLDVKVTRKVVHCSQASARFLEHSVEGGMSAVKGAEARWEDVGMADCAAMGLNGREFDALEGIPHTVAVDRAPNPVEFALTGMAEGFHVCNPGSVQSLEHAAADSSDVIQVEPVEDLGEIFEVYGNEAIGLIELARELGDEAVGREADRGGNIGADLFGEGGFDFESFAAGDGG